MDGNRCPRFQKSALEAGLIKFGILASFEMALVMFSSVFSVGLLCSSRSVWTSIVDAQTAFHGCLNEEKPGASGLFFVGILLRIKP